MIDIFNYITANTIYFRWVDDDICSLLHQYAMEDFTVQYHRNNNPQLDMSYQYSTLYWLRVKTNQPLLLLLNIACSAKKEQILFFKSLANDDKKQYIYLLLDHIYHKQMQTKPTTYFMERHNDLWVFLLRALYIVLGGHSIG